MCRTILNQLIKDLDSAIEITENRELKNIDMSSVISAFSNMREELKGLSNSLGISVSQMMKAFSKIQLSKVQFDVLKINKNVLFQNVPTYGQKDDE